jgi:hypothetical protein
MARRSESQLLDRAIAAIRDAAAASGLAVAVVDVPPEEHMHVDALLEFRLDDRTVVQQLQALNGKGRPGILVSPRITAEARRLLEDAGWSWLDERGRLHLRGPGVIVDRDVPPTGDQVGSGRRTGPPVAGRSGVAVAYWLCTHPTQALSPNRQKDELQMAPSTLSVANQRLRDAGLLADDGTGVFPELFFELADSWQMDRTWLAQSPPPERHRSSDPGRAWRRTGTAAAAAYGAPVVSATGGPVELYVEGPVDISTSLRRYGRGDLGTGAAALCVAPAAAVLAAAHPGSELDVGDWPAAPLVAVALDLAQDRARGREVLADWDHPDAIWR